MPAELESVGGESEQTAVADVRDPFGHFAFEFDRIDRNGDGWLSAEELHLGLLSAGWEQDEVCGLFDAIDVNKDGKITREEFLNYRSAGQSKVMALDPKTVFSELDANGDGGLDMEEFAKLIKGVNEKAGFLQADELDAYVKRHFAIADTNGDQRLSLEEFLPWYDDFVRYMEDVREYKQGGTENAIIASRSFTGDGLWECELPNICEAMDAAWARKKTPLLIDYTDVQRDPFLESPLETVLSYGDYEFLELKRMVVDVNMTRSKPLQQAREEARLRVANALKHGRVLTLLLSNSSPPLTSQFASPDTLPLAIFDVEQARAVSGLAKWDGLWVDKVLRAHDRCERIGEFRVAAVTKLKAAHYHNFLREELPLHLMQPIHVVMPPPP